MPWRFQFGWACAGSLRIGVVDKGSRELKPAVAETLPILGELTARQAEVLDAALRLLVSMGDKLTMTAVARSARCSKETLYKWFGDRDGLLTATVQWQAAKVGMPRIDRAGLTRNSLRAGIAEFGESLLRVLASETSVALNRIAVTHAGTDRYGLGAIVLENGRREMGRRLRPVLEAGRSVGYLHFKDSEEAFRTFFGLVVRDVQVRRLLGDDFAPDEAEIVGDAQRATEQFMTLYGT